MSEAIRTAAMLLAGGIRGNRELHRDGVRRPV